MYNWLKYYEYDNTRLQNMEKDRINNAVDGLTHSEIYDELGVLYYLLASCVVNKEMDMLEKYMRRYNSLLEMLKLFSIEDFEYSYFRMFFYYVDAFLYMTNNMLEKARSEFDVVCDMCLESEKLLEKSCCTEIEKMLFYRSYIGIYEVIDSFYSSMGMHHKCVEISVRQRRLLGEYYNNSSLKQVRSNDTDFDSIMMYIKLSAKCIKENNSLQCKKDCDNAIELCQINSSILGKKIWKCLEMWCKSCFILNVPYYNRDETNKYINEVESCKNMSLSVCENAIIICSIANFILSLGIANKNECQIQEAIDCYKNAYGLFVDLCEIKDDSFENRLSKKIISFFYPSYVNAVNFLASVYCENEKFGLAENTYIELLRLLNDNRYVDIVAEIKELFIINANSMLCNISCLKREIDKAEYYGQSCLDLLDNNDRLKKNAIAYDLCVKSCLALGDTYLMLKRKKDAERWSEYGLKYIEIQKENDCTTENTNNNYDILVKLSKKSKKRGFLL